LGIDSQTMQVNLLLQIKETLRKVTEGEKSDGRLQDRGSYIIARGYKLTKVVSSLTFPTSVAFDEQGRIYVAEAGFAYGTEPGEGRVLRVDEGGEAEVIADGFLGPVTSTAWKDGHLYVAEGARGGHAPGCGRITKLYPER
jgi:sugar lactone lactonase YvrE